MINLAGQRFGSLVALFEEGRVHGQIAWTCDCDCGRRVRVRGSTLRNGRTTSCGCKRNQNKRTHGMTDSPEYYAWNNMRTRCYHKKHKDYPLYGGRGITVHPEWLGPGSFEKFLAHIGPRPSPLHSLDRIDCDGNYEPGNVRWALAKTQAHNTRVRRTNKTGVAGVRVKDDVFFVSIQVTEIDFFEACCIRKSLENRFRSQQ